MLAVGAPSLLQDPQLVQAAVLCCSVLCCYREQVLPLTYGSIFWPWGPFIRGAVIQLKEPGQTR